MVGNTQREQFTNLRFDNYSTARKIGFTCGTFIRNALFLNGLTIELTYKQILLEAENLGYKLTSSEKKIIRNSHDLEELHRICNDKGILLEISEHESFLAFANLFYKTRYPIHMTEIMEKARKRFKSISFGIHTLFPYDEFICELDYLLYVLTKDNQTSILYRSLLHINNHKTLSIYHSNYFAFKYIDTYIGFLDMKKDDEKNSNLFLTTRRKEILYNAGQYLSSSEEGVLSSSYKRFHEVYLDQNY